MVPLSVSPRLEMGRSSNAARSRSHSRARSSIDSVIVLPLMSRMRAIVSRQAVAAGEAALHPVSVGTAFDASRLKSRHSARCDSPTLRTEIRIMGRWEQLFIDGEFMSRARLLSGLTIEQVSARPSGIPHTIYEELWHTAKWQSIVVQCDERAEAAWIDGGQNFPSEPPGNVRAWEDLVSEFLAGSETAVELGRSHERLTEEVSPGVDARREPREPGRSQRVPPREDRCVASAPPFVAAMRDSVTSEKRRTMSRQR